MVDSLVYRKTGAASLRTTTERLDKRLILLGAAITTSAENTNTVGQKCSLFPPLQSEYCQYVTGRKTQLGVLLMGVAHIQ